jgi:hypothetical protein
MELDQLGASVNVLCLGDSIKSLEVTSRKFMEGVFGVSVRAEKLQYSPSIGLVVLGVLGVNCLHFTLSCIGSHQWANKKLGKPAQETKDK